MQRPVPSMSVGWAQTGVSGLYLSSERPQLLCFLPPKCTGQHHYNANVRLCEMAAVTNACRLRSLSASACEKFHKDMRTLCMSIHCHNSVVRLCENDCIILPAMQSSIAIWNKFHFRCLKIFFIQWFWSCWRTLNSIIILSFLSVREELLLFLLLFQFHTHVCL